jgi:hypothetical protein
MCVCVCACVRVRVCVCVRARARTCAPVPDGKRAVPPRRVGGRVVIRLHEVRGHDRDLHASIRPAADVVTTRRQPSPPPPPPPPAPPPPRPPATAITTTTTSGVLRVNGIAINNHAIAIVTTCCRPPINGLMSTTRLLALAGRLHPQRRGAQAGAVVVVGVAGRTVLHDQGDLRECSGGRGRRGDERGASCCWMERRRVRRLAVERAEAGYPTRSVDQVDPRTHLDILVAGRSDGTHVGVVPCGRERCKQGGEQNTTNTRGRPSRGRAHSHSPLSLTLHTRARTQSRTGT